MCGSGSSGGKKAPVTPTYQYFPEAARSPQQQAAAVEATGAQSQASFGSELGSGAAAAPAAAKTGGGD